MTLLRRIGVFLASLSLESRLLLAFGAVFGLNALWFIPPVSTFDAPSHYHRILELSRGEIRSIRFSELGLGSHLPAGDARFVDTLWNSYWVKKDFLDLDRWAALSRETAKEMELRQIEFTNTAVYSPVNYVVPAVGTAVVRALGAGPLAGHRVASLCNLLLYLGLVTLAIELLPRARRGALLLATSPFLFIQSATLSTDGVNYGLPLLLLAWAWHLRERPVPPSPRTLLAIFALGWVVALLKPVAIVCLFCLWLIPSAGFGSRTVKFTSIALHLAAAVGLWYWWNHPYIDVDSSQWLEPGHPHTKDFKDWTLAHPQVFLTAFVQYLGRNLWEQWLLFYANVGGWISPDLHRFLHLLSLGFFVALLGCEERRNRPDWIWSGGMFLQAMGLLGLTCLTLFIILGYPGLDHIPGVSGRYLVFIYTGLWFAWSEASPRFFPAARKWFFYAGLGLNLTGVGAILFTTAQRVIT